MGTKNQWCFTVTARVGQQSWQASYGCTKEWKSCWTHSKKTGIYFLTILKAYIVGKSCYRDHREDTQFWCRSWTGSTLCLLPTWPRCLPPPHEGTALRCSQDYTDRGAFKGVTVSALLTQFTDEKMFCLHYVIVLNKLSGQKYIFVVWNSEVYIHI